MDYFVKIALIKLGVNINDYVIISTGAVVTKSVPNGSIVGGNSAKIIGDIFSLETRMLKYNMHTKGLNSKEKRDYLLKQNEEFFIKK